MTLPSIALPSGRTFKFPSPLPTRQGVTLCPQWPFRLVPIRPSGKTPITITKSRAFPFSWTGEERYAMEQGPGALSIQQNQIAQAMRAAVNEIETDLALAVAIGGSRAYGTAGTTPFASSLIDLAQLKKDPRRQRRFRKRPHGGHQHHGRSGLPYAHSAHERKPGRRRFHAPPRSAAGYLRLRAQTVRQGSHRGRWHGRRLCDQQRRGLRGGRYCADRGHRHRHHPRGRRAHHWELQVSRGERPLR